MAQNPYNPVADVAADSRAPDATQHIEANASSFGGTIAQGVEKLGAGATDMSKFWGHVQADDASNNAQKEASDFAEHIKTLEGQDALDAQKGAYKSLDDIYNKYKNQLATPEQQHIFDGQNRPFFDRTIRGQLNTVFVTAGKQFAERTSKTGIENWANTAATAGSDGNWGTVEVSRNKIYEQEFKLLQQQGLSGDPGSITAAQDRATVTAYKSGIEGMLQKNPDAAWDKIQDPEIKKKLGAAYEPLAKSVELGVAQAYISKADAMEVNNPTKVEQFVRDNEAKFGKAYGSALDKAHRAGDTAVAKGAAIEDWDKADTAPKAPPAPVAAHAMHIGDSIATGTAAVQYGEGWKTNPDVTARVGARPEGVLGQLKTVAASKPNAFAGRDVVLSTGTSNLQADGAWSRTEFDTTGAKVIGEQLDTLKANGADMSRVRVLGVGPGAGGDYANNKIRAIAASYGARFNSIPATDYGEGGVHTTAAGYTKMVGGASDGGGGATARPAATATDDQLYNAFHGQESGGGRNITTSIDDAHGDMQIIPDTFKRFAKPGERIDNRADNIAVGKRILSYYREKYDGDAARVAVAYFSGEGNVAPPGSPTPWKSNRRDGQGTFVSQYVNGILTRLGHPGVSGGPHPVSSTSYADQPTAVRGWDGATPSAEAPAPGAPAAEPAAFTPPAPPAPEPQTPEDVVNAIYDRQSAAIRALSTRGLTPEQEEQGKREIIQRANFAIAAAGEQQRAIKAREDEATNDVLGVARKDGYTAAYQKLNAYMNDPKRPLTEKQFDTLNEVLERRSGNSNPIHYGPSYNEAFNNIVKPKDEASRISDEREILRMEADGKVTEKGANSLLHALSVMKKSAGEFGIMQRIGGVQDYAKSYLDKSVNEPFMTIKDPEGKNKYDLEFLSMFHTELDTWRNAGKNLGDNPLLAPDHKALDQLLQSIRSRTKINEFNMQAGVSTPFKQEPVGTPPPPAPENINAQAWGGLMQKPPKVGGVEMPHAMWGGVLTALAADPRPQVIASFDKYFGPGGFDGAKVAAALNAEHQRGNREEITPQETAPMRSKQHDREVDEWLHSIPGWLKNQISQTHVGEFRPENALHPALRRAIGKE